MTRYLTALAAVFGATAIRLSVTLFSRTEAPFSFYYLATILTVSLAGAGPAVLAALLGGLTAEYYFVAPLMRFSFWEPANALWELLYLCVSATIIGAVEAQRRYRAKAEAAQRKSIAILESISDGFNALDREWRYTYVNAAGAAMVGKTPEQLLGKNLWEMWPEAVDSPFGHAYRRAIAENTTLRVEAFFPPLNAWFEVRCFPSPEGLSLFFTDITERRHTEERLQQKQKLESIGLLAGGIAHDFNNILTVIIGSASVALDECADCSHSRNIVTASERATYLTKQLLAYAGKGRVDRKPVHLTELVTRSMELLHASAPKRVSLKFDLAENLPPVEADVSQMEQILMNLVINASEAISRGHDGHIRIATSNCDVTPEMARKESASYTVEPGEYVCLEVEDNGSGMDETTAFRIFDPFFTTKFTGRGLGLAAVHGIVRSSQGFIRVSSQPGAGATFRVFLPACGPIRKAEPIEPKRPVATRPVPISRATVLVVDDEEMVRKVAGLALRRHGYTVLEADNDREALEVLSSAPSRPDIVLLDLAMPVMGAEELIPLLNANYPGLRVVVSSGYPEEETRQVLSSGSINGFLQKPYNGETLAETIRRALAEAGS